MDSLDYVVPEGQDPAVVLTALSREGYSATPEPGQVNLLHIDCPSGPEQDRAAIRRIIESVHTTGIDSGAPFDPGSIRFVDER